MEEREERRGAAAAAGGGKERSEDRFCFVSSDVSGEKMDLVLFVALFTRTGR
jgi:hypothetical protein